jgi:hypothetical protein
MPEKGVPHRKWKVEKKEFYNRKGNRGYGLSFLPGRESIKSFFLFGLGCC